MHIHLPHGCSRMREKLLRIAGDMSEYDPTLDDGGGLSVAESFAGPCSVKGCLSEFGSRCVKRPIYTVAPL